MDFPVGYALSLNYQQANIDFFVQGSPQGELCITCQHPIFSQRFSGGTKCFHPFMTAPFLPDETDEHFAFFAAMKALVLREYEELQAL